MMRAILAEELNQLIVDKEPLFLFDVRNVSDFNDWKVEGDNIEYLNVPYLN